MAEKVETGTVRAGTPDREQFALDVVLRCFGSAVGADSGLLLTQGEGERPRLRSAWGLAERHATVPWTTNSFLGRAITAAAPSLEPSSETGGAASTWDAVAAPIVGPSGSLGAIYAGFDPASGLDPERLRWIAGSHARLAALCLDGGPGVAAALRSSGIDHLTGCLTYEHTLDMLRAEIERSQRHGHRLSCCFLDIDGLKQINDTGGHLEGNTVLACAGEALRSAARPYDFVGRFGGDEFVIVLPETGAPSARRAVDRMRWRVTFAVEEATGRVVQASAGIAEWRKGMSMLDLLDASDHALQRAKADGGGRVTEDAAIEGRLEGLVELTRAVFREQRGGGSR